MEKVETLRERENLKVVQNVTTLRFLESSCFCFLSAFLSAVAASAALSATVDAAGSASALWLGLASSSCTLEPTENRARLKCECGCVNKRENSLLFGKLKTYRAFQCAAGSLAPDAQRIHTLCNIRLMKDREHTD